MATIEQVKDAKLKLEQELLDILRVWEQVNQAHIHSIEIHRTGMMSIRRDAPVGIYSVMLDVRL